MKLSPSQKRIMLVLCNAAESGELEHSSTGVFLRNREKHGYTPIRETTTGAALVRKGVAVRLSSGAFSATDEGYWLGDGLRSEDYLGKIPARRSH